MSGKRQRHFVYSEGLIPKARFGGPFPYWGTEFALTF